MVRAATISICSSITILVGAVALDPAAKAESAEALYKGKTIEVYSGNSASGAYSTYARLMQRHIGKYLPGTPTTVMKFMPGAGGITFANWLYAVAPKDGTVFGIFHQRMGVEPLIAPNPSIKFNGRRYTWIGSLGKQSGVCFTWHTTPIKTVADAQANETVVGFSGSTSADAVMPRMMNAMLGTKFKGIGGYSGTDILLAMERGELQGRCGFGWVSLKTTRPEWIKEKKVNLLVQFALKPHPDLPHVPVMTDLVTNPDDRKALQLVFGTTEMGRPFAAPPEVPSEQAAALRRAFMKAANDPALLKEADNQRLEIDPLSGDDIQKLVAELYETPKPVVDRVVSFLGKKKKKKD